MYADVRAQGSDALVGGEWFSEQLYPNGSENPVSCTRNRKSLSTHALGATGLQQWPRKYGLLHVTCSACLNANGLLAQPMTLTDLVN